jgi:vacuolar-type H+-ATPase subunit E/Vma4
LQKGVVKGVEQGFEQGTKRAEEQALNRDRQIILTIIQRRFPELLNATKQCIAGVQDPEQLQSLVIKISLAQDSHEVRLALAEVEHDKE